MLVDVFNIKGKKTKKQIDLPKEIFGITPNEHAVYLDVKRWSIRDQYHKNYKKN